MVCDKGPGLSKETDTKVLERLWCGQQICSLDLLMLIDHNWHWLMQLMLNNAKNFSGVIFYLLYFQI